MIAALCAAIQSFSSSRIRFARVAEREVDRHRQPRPERADDDEHRERSGLLAGVGAGLRDRGGRADRQQQVLGVDAESAVAIAIERARP